VTRRPSLAPAVVLPPQGPRLDRVLAVSRFDRYARLQLRPSYHLQCLSDSVARHVPDHPYRTGLRHPRKGPRPPWSFSRVIQRQLMGLMGVGVGEVGLFSDALGLVQSHSQTEGNHTRLLCNYYVNE